MKQDLEYYLGLKYPVLLTEGEDNGEPYVEAEIPELPGCGSYGKNRREALDRLEEAKKGWIEARLKRGLSIPEPVSEEDFSGRFLLRITPDMHRKLVAGAKRKNLSLNQYVRKALEDSVSLESILEKLNGLEQKLNDLDKAIENPQFISVGDAGVVPAFGTMQGIYVAYGNTVATWQNPRFITDRETRRPSPAILRATTQEA